MLDLVLAILHHLAAFTLLGCLGAQFVMLRSMPDSDTARLLANLDIGYGLSAAAVLAAGFSRALFASKGWTFYAQDLAFWAKIAVFAAVALISIRPSLWFRQWLGIPAASIMQRQVAAARRLVALELLLFPLIPVFAAMMARGFWLL